MWYLYDRINGGKPRYTGHKSPQREKLTDMVYKDYGYRGFVNTEWAEVKPGVEVIYSNDPDLQG